MKYEVYTMQIHDEDRKKLKITAKTNAHHFHNNDRTVTIPSPSLYDVTFTLDQPKINNTFIVRGYLSIICIV